MPPYPLRPSRAQMEDLAVICAIEERQLRAAAVALGHLGLVIDREKIEEALKASVGQPAATVLARFLFGVATPLRQDKTFATRAFDGVEHAIKEAADPMIWQNWPRSRALLEEMVDSPSVRLSSKARDISYDFERLYLAGRFLTSIRPVFDDDRVKILGATIVQTLRLEYSSSDGEHSISLALDRNEIELLKDACEDALRKSDIAAKEIVERWVLPVTIPGELSQ